MGFATSGQHIFRWLECLLLFRFPVGQIIDFTELDDIYRTGLTNAGAGAEKELVEVIENINVLLSIIQCDSIRWEQFLQRCRLGQL